MRKHALLGSAAILLIASYGATAQTNTGQKAEGSSGTPSAQTTTDPSRSAPSGERAPAQKPQAPAATRTQATQPSTTPAAPGAAQQTPNGTPQNSSGKSSASPPAAGSSPNTGAAATNPTQAPAGTAQQSPQTTPNAQQRATQPNAGAQQSPQQQATQPNGGAQQNQQATQPNSGAQQNPGQQATSPNKNNGTQQNAQQDRAPGGVVSLNAQQRTQIGQTIARHNVKPVTNVNFSIAVGTAVPRSVQLRAIPADLVTFIPQYRGYSYFVVEEQIVIVEPASYQIIAVVPYAGAGGNRAAAPAPTQSRAVKLSTQEREVVRKHTSSRREEGPARKTSKRYSVGDEVDTTITVEEFPETVYREAPIVRRYRYFRQDNDVILVDPDERRVIDVLE